MIAFEIAQGKLRERKILSQEEHQTCIDVLKEMNDVSFHNASNMTACLKRFVLTGDTAHRKEATIFAKAYMTPIHRNTFAGLSSDMLKDGGDISRKIMAAGNKGALAMQEAFG